jgi:cyanophycinase
VKNSLIVMALTILTCVYGPHALAQEPPSSPAPPTFVGVGGALKDDNEAVFKALLSQTATGTIVIVPYSSADTEGAIKASTERFTRLRPTARCVAMPDSSKGHDERREAAAMVAHADLVWFSGGDQSRLISRFYDGGKPNEVLQALRAAAAGGQTVIGGTSAGCACLSDPMFTGGGSEAALGGVAKDDDAEPTEKAPSGSLREPPPPPKAAGEGKQAGPQIGRGLGLVPGVILDSHFAQRGRIGRMIAALDKTGMAVGVGVNENRAIEVRDESFRGIGETAALVVDTRQLKREGLSRLATRVSILGDGDVCRVSGTGVTAVVAFEMPGTAAPRPPSAAEPKPAAAFGAKAWDKNVVVELLHALADAPDSQPSAQSDRFEIMVSADDRTKFFRRGPNPDALSIVEARIDIIDRKTAPEAAPKPAGTPEKPPSH